MDAIAQLNQYYNQHDLHINQVLEMPDGLRAQIIYSPNDTYEKWLTTKGYPTINELIQTLTTIKDNAMTSIFKLCGDVFQYMSAEMLPKDKPVTLTINSLQQETVHNQKGENLRAVLYFKETKNGLVLGNKTNIRSLVNVFETPDVSEWVGKKVVLQTETCRAFGKTHTVIRINETATIQANAKVDTGQPALIEMPV